MWIQDPAKLMAISDAQFFEEGLMHNQRSRMEFALKMAAAIPSAADVAEAVAFIAEACGIAIADDQLLRILSLYPAARGKFADYGWGDTEIRELTLDVIAHFFMSSRWPLGIDDVDVDRFVARLKKAAVFMGYHLVP